MSGCVLKNLLVRSDYRRVAWLNITGLPFIVADRGVLETLVKPVGSLVRITVISNEVTSLPCIKVCVLTNRGDNIQISHKIMIDNHMFLVSIKEGGGDEAVKIVTDKGYRNRKVKVSSWLESMDLRAYDSV